MNYSDDNHSVRVDFFKESGKWYCTEAVKFFEYQGQIHHAFAKALALHLKKPNGPVSPNDSAYRLSGMTAVCLEPYHDHAHPLMMSVDDAIKLAERL